MVKRSSANIVAHGSIRGRLGWGSVERLRALESFIQARELGGLRGGHDGVCSR